MESGKESFNIYVSLPPCSGYMQVSTVHIEIDSITVKQHLVGVMQETQVHILMNDATTGVYDVENRVSCSYAFVYMMCPFARLMGDSAIDLTGISNSLIKRGQVLQMMRISTHFQFGG